MTTSILNARGSNHQPAASASNALARFGRRLWQAFERAGARRAAPQLHALADMHELRDPELAQQFRDAANNLMRG